jgi:hypothetical protein
MGTLAPAARLQCGVISSTDWFASPQEATEMNAGKKIRNLMVSVSVLSALLLSVLVVSPAAAATNPLTADEIAGLQFMREEEKLARDVYLTLYQKWGVTTFNNIASSEATHMASIKTLLDRYGIADPAAGQPIGGFTNPELQVLYNQLIAQGSQSLAAALQVGVTIEQVDIRDLQTRLASTTHSDIKSVYNNLLRGSTNHLRAFTNQLQTQTGAVTQPQYPTAGTTPSTTLGAPTGRRGGGSWR